MVKKIVDQFTYKNHNFVIVKNGEWFMAVNKADINDDGTLKRTIWGGYRSIPELIKTEQMRIDIDELVDGGMDRMEAVQLVVMGKGQSHG